MDVSEDGNRRRPRWKVLGSSSCGEGHVDEIADHNGHAEDDMR